MIRTVLLFIGISISVFSGAQDSLVVKQDSLSIVPNPLLIQSDIPGPATQVPFVASEVIETPRKKFHISRVRILLAANYTFYNPIVNQKDIYSGEFKQHEDSAAVWVNRNNTYNLNKYLTVKNFQVTLQGNFWKGLFIGFHYQFFTLKNYKQDPVGGNLLSKKNAMFFLVGSSFAYAFDFLKNKNLQVMPSIRIGSYSADDYYDAKGKKIYVGLDCKFRYYIKNKFGFTLGVDYDFLRYKSNSYSDLFQQASYKKVTFNNIHLNAGICYNINIRLAEK